MALVGERVVVSGLLRRPELNSQVGEATSFDEANGRYTVRIGTEQIALRPMNVERAPFRSSGAPAETLEPHAKVRIHGLSARAELNSCGGTILCWHADKGRYGVQVEGSLETVLLRPTNLEEADAIIENKERELLAAEAAEAAKHPFGAGFGAAAGGGAAAV
ncbi:hypothetical protein EMIHUDRAFT_252010 [Emiliania huxleyi CCMP1516]|uniref:Uncharacterized protein n=2 Tax=Emiliania huxleyi TaxID=2903 RepID=A0A0D3KPN1_EMIH1|nr:hypothetical protein EMIHUDRAFT_203763 [Emiliania huxleyi CCMP1516]XP_005790145.1 hypothetical protein EMIHUDRAFT_252010 [Emiliania huxleyi CCMP1516]EOD29214.1 hypothetical protein EMIHUDRAFT_203763 [Emiliania huxleyi CCMP1516]EOD37716.1 hypothetical protein EMIHUDRAFT_252010 [Emiliania huxleyi CCMP1516]|eukprot:XP_005781643.1 hypothetical protein EMIHUDRAFT_203763 [Emiliania huxleyi CCMP1516]